MLKQFQGKQLWVGGLPTDFTVTTAVHVLFPQVCETSSECEWGHQVDAKKLNSRAT